MRVINRTTVAARQTISNLLENVGRAASDYQAKAFVNLPCEVLECDEIWSFCYSKEKNVPKEKQGELGSGDVWTWMTIDTDTKILPYVASWGTHCFHVYVFLSDLKSRPKEARIQFANDGLRNYLTVENGLWGMTLTSPCCTRSTDPASKGKAPTPPIALPSAPALIFE